MAFSAIVRRATSPTARYSVEFCIRRQSVRSLNFAPLRSLPTGEILNRGEGSQPPSSFLPLARFSSLLSKKQAADAELIQIIKSEIKCADEEHLAAEEIPKGFPFEIQDEEGSNIITLRRDYLGEKIEAIVSMPRIEEPDNIEGVGDGDAGRAGDEKINQPAIPLTVNISKSKELNLEFSCTAFADEIVIDSLSVQRKDESDDGVLAYEGPDFNDLDENLQKAFHKFLEIRGISPATTNFLYEYMIHKDDKEYCRWLQNLKQFIEK
ncbi:uncharacterized protein At2g39795, mitochondrial-like isoform X1 [Phalaenopsis equestris]|uniref:uncharacterized protein At2g39795, mitochondrial-like isoform X1 n=1 Tax=Phalaenopsis equestris TaxID=78828 RepID=UPI0009E5DAF5|nr:uncharacterized protein At2g39795, mitochondrial-like isoform X1 [Phalaenopsis equestris]